MEEQELIPVQLLCKRYNVPNSFIDKLQEYQLIEVIVKRDHYYVHITQVRKIEKLIRLHYELEINLEGVDVINNLLNQLEALKSEVKMLQNRLRIYED